MDEVSKQFGILHSEELHGLAGYTVLLRQWNLKGYDGLDMWLGWVDKRSNFGGKTFWKMDTWKNEMEMEK